MQPRRLKTIALASGCIFLFFWFHPVVSKKSITVCALAGTISLLTVWPLPRSKTVISIAYGAGLILFSSLFWLPGKTIEPDTLHDLYIESLMRYKGVRYVWGGEGKLGIDCSGLPRRALRDALIKTGFSDFNGAAFRLAVFHLWNDASASAIARGFMDYAIPLEVGGILKDIDTTKLTSGDLAITADGIHVLVFLGQHLWIEADPDIGSVTILHTGIDTSPWFSERVSLYRWKLLSKETESQ
jgi:hypothetical protein